MEKTLMSEKHWSGLMGSNLERFDSQPLQPVRTNRKGAAQISVRSMRALGFWPGDRLRLQLREGRCILHRDPRQGSPFAESTSFKEGVVFQAGKPIRLPVPEHVADALSHPDAVGALLVSRDGEGEILPIHVQEHPPDLLGPRFIDEVCENHIVRHATPGLPYNSWKLEALRELEEMLCSEPFRIDPLSVIADGDDWVGWMTRNRILEQPAPQDGQLRTSWIDNVLHDQQTDGSWGTVPGTAYAILRLLMLRVPGSDKRLRRAAKWLLGLPEPLPRPEMWMLTTEYLDEWLAKRQPKEQRDFRPGEFHWEPPDDARNFFSWRFPEYEQDQFRGQEMQQVIPICARHHPPACEPRITHVSALVAEALIRCGYADHPRLRRYVNTLFHLGGEWGYWCGCGALGLYDADIPASESPPDLNVRSAAEDGACDPSAWRWVSKASDVYLLANQPDLPRRGTHLEPFSWYRIPGAVDCFALIGTAWQNGDCWAKTNRALSQHPTCPHSLAECLAIYQASRYQTPLGEWDQGFPAGLLTFLSLYNHGAAKALAIKTVPWLRAHQADDGLWHHEELERSEWGKLAEPPGSKLATYHIVAALHRFGLLDRLRP